MNFGFVITWDLITVDDQLASISISLWSCWQITCNTWWRHQMETFSALLAICAGNSPVTGEFPTQRPVTRSFDVFFDLRLNIRLSKQWRDWWFERPSCPLWRHSNVPHMHIIASWHGIDYPYLPVVKGILRPSGDYPHKGSVSVDLMFPPCWPEHIFLTNSRGVGHLRHQDVVTCNVSHRMYHYNISGSNRWTMARLALAVRQFADGEYWSSLAKYDQSPFAILAKEIYYRRSQYTIQF